LHTTRTQELEVEVERVTTDLALVKAERDGYILAVSNRERECRELDDAKREMLEIVRLLKREVKLLKTEIADPVSICAEGRRYREALEKVKEYFRKVRYLENAWTDFTRVEIEKVIEKVLRKEK